MSRVLREELRLLQGLVFLHMQGVGGASLCTAPGIGMPGYSVGLVLRILFAVDHSPPHRRIVIRREQ